MGPLAFIAIGASLLGAYNSYQGARASAQSMREGAAIRQEAAKFEADQANIQAGQAIAMGQHAAAIEERASTYLQSRQLALAGASGAGASDPGMVTLIARTAGEGSYRAAVQLYQGEEQARQLRLQAASYAFEGQAAARGMEQRANAYDTEATASLVRGVGNMSLYGRYFGGGPNSSASGDAALLRTGSGSLSWT